MPASGHVFMCGPLSVEYMTIVFSARPCSSRVEDLSGELVVVDHRVVVLGLPAPGLAAAAVLDVGPEVHVGGVEPDKEGRVVVLGVGHEPQRLRDDLVVERL